MKIYDLTHTIRNDMPVYPGTEQPRLTTACTIEEVGYRETLLHMYSHTGIAGSGALNALLAQRGTSPVADGCRLIDLLRRPQIGYDDLRPFDPEAPALPRDIVEQVEITVKYEGYIQRQQKQVEEFERLERRLLPEDLDYAHIQGLRLEAREKLSAVRPRSLGQAGRISGVSPADMAALMIYLGK